MPIRPIVALPHPALRRVAAPVAAEDIRTPRIQRLVSDMRETLRAAPDGVGLAAPQVGLPLRIFLVSEEAEHISEPAPPHATPAPESKRAWRSQVFINPVATKRSRAKSRLAEGCLSLPGKFGEVPRSEKVYLEWHDERGRKHGRGFTKFIARVIQHELDHLDGVLIADRVEKLFSTTKTNNT